MGGALDPQRQIKSELAKLATFGVVHGQTTLSIDML